MPETTEYYFKRADEVESSGTTAVDPLLKQEFHHLAQALRAIGNTLKVHRARSIGGASDAEIERLAERIINMKPRL
jgi:hypothetical protein